MSAQTFGFVFTYTTYRTVEGDTVTVNNEHPAYRDEGTGVIAWAPHRDHWRDAPATIAATFRTRVDGFDNPTRTAFPITTSTAATTPQEVNR